MLSISEEIRREAQMENSEQIAMRLLRKGNSVEDVADSTMLPAERIQELAQNLAEGKEGKPTH